MHTSHQNHHPKPPAHRPPTRTAHLHPGDQLLVLEALEHLVRGLLGQAHALAHCLQPRQPVRGQGALAHHLLHLALEGLLRQVGVHGGDLHLRQPQHVAQLRQARKLALVALCAAGKGGRGWVGGGWVGRTGCTPRLWGGAHSAAALARCGNAGASTTGGQQASTLDPLTDDHGDSHGPAGHVAGHAVQQEVAVHIQPMRGRSDDIFSRRPQRQEAHQRPGGVADDSCDTWTQAVPGRLPAHPWPCAVRYAPSPRTNT